MLYKLLLLKQLETRCHIVSQLRADILDLLSLLELSINNRAFVIESLGSEGSYSAQWYFCDVLVIAYHVNIQEISNGIDKYSLVSQHSSVICYVFSVAYIGCCACGPPGIYLLQMEPIWPVWWPSPSRPCHSGSWPWAEKTHGSSQPCLSHQLRQKSREAICEMSFSPQHHCLLLKNSYLHTCLA